MHFRRFIVVACSCLAALAVSASSAAGKTVVDLADANVSHEIAPSSSQVTIATDGGLRVTIAPGKETYPGIAIKPPGGHPWDLSAAGDVCAKLVNTGKTPIAISLRLDNAGPWQESPFSTESISLKPGESGQIKVIFGYSYGYKPSYALKPSAIVQMLFFAGKSEREQSFRIESIEALGPAGEKPPVDPESVRVEPADGFILGGSVAIDPAKQIASSTNSTATIDAGKSEIVFSIPPGGKEPGTLKLKPAIGRWDLRMGSVVHVKLKNAGSDSIAPKACVHSNGGATDTVGVAQPIGPGGEGEIVIPFAPAVVWQGIPNSGNRTSWNGQPNTGTGFTSDAVSAVEIILPPSQNGQSIVVRSIRLEAPAASLPSWLGQRPPVDGEWTKTFDDEFDGTAIDESKWNVVGKNYYDQQSRFVKENVIVSDGLARLHFEKRPGKWANPADGKETKYASGFLDTYGKFTQRYGYFEARMKLPKSPGLWPAFWMMPDRGAAFSGDRGNTGDGGMEFDIMEHLTRWGPSRYNIAMHWDGYGKEHKQTGTGTIYVQPDKDGFITAGLLWTPGSAIYYCNGKEVARWDDKRISSVPADLMFTFPMGGWDNNALDDSKLPADFVIDYVRCWQRKDLKAGESGDALKKGKQ